jgi:hypothetical protein
MLKHKTSHTSCKRGKRVRVTLYSSDEIIISKFIETTSTHVILEDRKIAKQDLRTFGIYKEKKGK